MSPQQKSGGTENILWACSSASSEFLFLSMHSTDFSTVERFFSENYFPNEMMSIENVRLLVSECSVAPMVQMAITASDRSFDPCHRYLYFASSSNLQRMQWDPKIFHRTRAKRS